MDAEQVAARAAEIIRKASDDAARARLAFVTGNYPAYVKQVFADAEKRLNDEYDALNGPRDVDDTGAA